MFAALGPRAHPCDNPGFLLEEGLALVSHPLNALKSLFKVINQSFCVSKTSIGSVLTAGPVLGGTVLPSCCRT